VHHLRLLCLALVSAITLPAATDAIHVALDRMYRFDFEAAHSILKAEIARRPDDPLPRAFRASAYLFQELDRLKILESEFFADDKRIAAKKKMKPDPAIELRFRQAVAEARKLADARLAKNASDKEALFAKIVAGGVETDYAALVEKRQISSLGNVRDTQVVANRLLKIDPTFYDAHLTTGVSEYVLGSLPFFLRWFIKVEGTEGSKDAAVENLKLVAKSGRYFGPFAKILLSLIHLREKRPFETERLLIELAHDYPENPLFSKELGKVSAKLKSGELQQSGSR
jgi:hypothetical protein